MAFLGKLGNVLEDAASFAVPAGLFALGTFAGGGNPLAGKALMGAAASGAGGFARNEEEERIRKAMEEAKRSAAIANLQNALSPGTGARGAAPVMGKPGFLEIASKGGAMGVQAFNAAKLLGQQEELRGFQLGKLKDEAMAREGANASLAGGVQVFESENRGGGPTPEVGRIAQPNELIEPPPPAFMGGFNQQALDTAQQALDTAQQAAQAGLGFDPGPSQPIAQAIGGGKALDTTMTTKEAEFLIEKDLVETFGPTSIPTMKPIAVLQYKTAIKEETVRVEGIIKDALTEALEKGQSSTPDVALELYAKRLSDANIMFSEKSQDEAMRFFENQTAGFDLKGEERKKLAGIIALDNSLIRVTSRIQDPEFEDAYGAIQGRVVEMQEAVASGTLDKELKGLLTDIGFTAEMAVRFFSGAAVRDEEFDRFRNVFIGSLTGSRENSLASIQSFRQGLSDQRNGIFTVAQIARTGDPFAGTSNKKLAQRALSVDQGGLNDWSARFTLERRLAQ